MNMVANLINSILFVPVFILSILAIVGVSRYGDDWRKRWFFCIVAVIVPSLFVGLRSVSVGTDVAVYVVPSFELALGSDFSFFMRNSDLEVGFSLLVYISSLLCNDVHFLLFLISVFVCFPVVCALSIVRKRINAPVSYFFFLMVFFLQSLNIMRQSIAVSICLLAAVLMYRRKWILSVLLSILAFSFHTTAVIGFAITLMLPMIARIENRKTFFGITVASLLFILMVFINWEPIISFFLKRGYLSGDKYNYYFSVFSGSEIYSGGYFFDYSFRNLIEITFKGLFCALFFVCYCRIGSDGKNNVFGRLLVLFTLCAFSINVFFLLFFKSIYGYRISMYGDFFLVLAAGYYCNHSERDRDFISFKKKIATSDYLIVISPILYFLSVYVMSGYHGVLPFSFFF